MYIACLFVFFKLYEDVISIVLSTRLITMMRTEDTVYRGKARFIHLQLSLTTF